MRWSAEFQRNRKALLRYAASTKASIHNFFRRGNPYEHILVHLIFGDASGIDTFEHIVWANALDIGTTSCGHILHYDGTLFQSRPRTKYTMLQ